MQAAHWRGTRHVTPHIYAAEGGSHAPCAIEVAWWPCTFRVAMLFLPRLAVTLKAMLLMVTNSFPFCEAQTGWQGAEQRH